ncbi:hypothetical protein l11_05370 [Neisseria weaveri LMG 5135]|nr:hypothetical protein l11_05370 [Neisseria weaveri LMG 5135]
MKKQNFKSSAFFLVLNLFKTIAWIGFVDKFETFRYNQIFYNFLYLDCFPLI